MTRAITVLRLGRRTVKSPSTERWCRSAGLSRRARSCGIRPASTLGALGFAVPAWSCGYETPTSPRTPRHEKTNRDLVVESARPLVLPRCAFRTLPLTSPPGSPVGFAATGRSLRRAPCSSRPLSRPLSRQLSRPSVHRGSYTERSGSRSDKPQDAPSSSRPTAMCSP